MRLGTEKSIKMYGGIEDGGETGLMADSMNAFSEASIRRGFVRKVYGILSAQLILTMAIVGIFYIPEVSTYALTNVWLFWMAFVATFVCLIVLACCPDVRRTSPGVQVIIFFFFIDAMTKIEFVTPF